MTPPAPRPAHPPARTLTELRGLLAGLGSLPPTAEPAVGAAGPPATRGEVVLRGVTHDSRAVRPGDLYAALPGAHAHGADFATAAAAAGAAAVLTDAAGAAALAGRLDAPVLATTNPRRDLAQIADWLYDQPSRKLTLLGVTGTNGKTTSAFLVDAGLRAAGHRTGLLGTVETRIGDERLSSARTTPESADLQALFAVMVERGVTAATMEVSSHALAQHRVDGLRFAGALFTNLSQDHLDYHPTMRDYFEAKATLFEPARSAVSVIGVDPASGDWGRRLADRVPGALTFAPAPPADWWAEDLVVSERGSTFTARGPRGSAQVGAGETDPGGPGLAVPVRVGLPGRFNVVNALGALALLVAAGVPAEAAAEGIGELTGVPGRMERVEAGQPYLALVDYAHTPDAVETVLGSVRGLVEGRLIVVLGCGGDRDRAKRPLMGAAAARLADLAFFTNDNPRSEDPAEILVQMTAGVARAGTSAAKVTVIQDRAEAIAAAVAEAGPGDAVVVAGKGHERGQEQDGVVTAFDDREALAAAIASALAAGPAAPAGGRPSPAGGQAAGR
ncbi:UDP-N-acetylmuramoyl-L-alanyl-D-glutamate--2,6-diaminopimelate ligase [Frankia sp. CNm7]|uniref:UDP-N-acetylmuramoyl-L-alanyl-D-glutamate--2,6-diaminopimelate ligase n=1 Tax=Frankia nepalensis TaxID=1836974 RepID=A0A937UP85_9ACTN|nr:UDP-N-acetylmuramoyl-L-alanyl-D-glutamate--2,6-diaminopimelate ligase [Frankia nepalensis]MBL7500358.1 UDP-N-acetylmuramoyl-L-alanyl-D-glutamate--2,6-diaminopimelate ligase [Frankia nepalensis]MBL7515613.1 UDP-N-acetylmuramoyl-L-alanyl-D-glutamate--2,6-diaminopimelate ligase [Frankia nepalensis]MBL7519456.1 UDP-N-acetylmuramoyl-L-alanyl-D-glutamate--2,6-diaminopimelate ligase [Frankia nepalensis]MBL7628817.1 UDP-N-acetylmuramoyl-L-alanyl-D-glutamate--2,6-diaminopimelate ligase [Frankia nepal